MSRVGDVSVVIPAYNSYPGVEQALDSVLRQTVMPRQIVVVDDGSDIPLESQISRNHESVQILRTSNAGPGGARHAGTSAASSSWIAFLDADDCWHPRFIEDQLAVARQFPGARVIVCDSDGVKNGKLVYRSKFALAPRGFWGQGTVPTEPILLGAEVYGMLISFQFMLVGSYLVNRTEYEDVGGFSSPLSRMPSEDFEFALRVAQGGGVVLNPEIRFTYQMGEETFSSLGQGFIAGDVRVLEYARRAHSRAKDYEGEVDASIDRRSEELCHLAFENRDLAAFRAFWPRVSYRWRRPKLAVKGALLHFSAISRSAFGLQRFGGDSRSLN